MPERPTPNDGGIPLSEPVRGFFAEYFAPVASRLGQPQGPESAALSSRMGASLIALQPRDRQQLLRTLIQQQVSPTLLQTDQLTRVMTQGVLTYLPLTEETRAEAATAYRSVAEQVSTNTNPDALAALEQTGAMLLSGFTDEVSEAEVQLGQTVQRVAGIRNEISRGQVRPASTIQGLRSLGFRDVLIQRVIEPEGDQPREEEEVVLPDRFTEADKATQLNRLLNNEAKLMALGLMAINPEARGAAELDRLLREAQGGYPGWEFADHLVREYCKWSFIKAGYVREVLIERRGRTVTGYQITRAGRDMLAAVGHGLALSEQYPDSSLQDIFSVATQSRETKDTLEGGSSYLRFRIISALANVGEGSIDESRLFEEIGISFEGRTASDKAVMLDRVRRHVKDLARNGIITYPKTAETSRYTNISGGRTSAEFPPVENPSSYRDFRGRVTFIIANSQHLSTSSVYDHLVAMFPEYTTHKERTVKSYIRATILQYADQGLLRAPTDTDISLTAFQAEHVKAIASTLERFHRGDPAYLDEGERKARELLGDERRVATLMKKAYEHSINTETMTMEEVRERTLEILALADRPLDASEIHEFMGEDVDQNHINRVLRRMETDQLVSSQKGRKSGGSRVYQRIPDQQEEPPKGSRREPAERVMHDRVRAFFALGVREPATIAQWMDVDVAEAERLTREVAGGQGPSPLATSEHVVSARVPEGTGAFEVTRRTGERIPTRGNVWVAGNDGDVRPVDEYTTPSNDTPDDNRGSNGRE